MLIQQLSKADVEALGRFVDRQKFLVRIASLADEAVEMLEEQPDYLYVDFETILRHGREGSSDLFVEHLGQEFAPLLKKFFRELSDEALRLRLEKEMEIHDPRG
jgi:hypothetical protein